MSAASDRPGRLGPASVRWDDSVIRLPWPAEQAGPVALDHWFPPVAGPKVTARTEEAGCYYFDDGGTDGLPSWYQSCFHTEAYVREVWGSRFRVFGYVPDGMCRSQDLVVLGHLP